MHRIILFLCLFSLTVFYSCSDENPSDSNQFFITEQDSSTAKEELTVISDSLELDPSNVRLWIKRGSICKDLLDFSCALDAGAKAYRLDSTNIEARKLYAWTLINNPDAKIQDIDNAKRHFKYALSIQPNIPETMVNLANTYALTGDFKTAMTYINDALRIDKKYKEGYVLKGSIYKMRENYDLALSSYQTAIQLDPDYFIAYLNTGWLLTEMNNHALALEYYTSASELNPENINALYGIAKSQQDLTFYNDALTEYRKITTIDPEFYVAYYNQGYIKQYYQADRDSALYFYRKTLDYNPQYTRAWYQMGECYYDLGNRKKAIDSYSNALRIDENYPPAKEAIEKLKSLN